MLPRIRTVYALLLGIVPVATCLLVATIGSAPVKAQIVFGPITTPDDFHPGARRAHVELLADTVEVMAGKPQTVELRFRVDPGFHINSHTPKDELLIPTVFKADEAGVKVTAQTYPKGSPFRLDVGDGELLDVYQNEFRVFVQVIAPKGASLLLGSLHYQACDHAACFPPKTLAVKVAVTGR